MKRWWVIGVLALIGVAALAAYAWMRPPPELEAKGPPETAAYLTLAAAIVSLATSVVTLVLKLFDLRQKVREQQ